MFNRNERDFLGKLSKLCFGTTSRWQKLYDSGKFDVGTQKIPLDRSPYVVVSHANGRKTSYSRDVALTLGKISPDELEKQEETLEQAYQVLGRRPTYTELVEGLNRAWEYRMPELMSSNDLSSFLAASLVVLEKDLPSDASEEVTTVYNSLKQDPVSANVVKNSLNEKYVQLALARK